jgi:hypothetical protein
MWDSAGSESKVSLTQTFQFGEKLGISGAWAPLATSNPAPKTPGVQADKVISQGVEADPCDSWKYSGPRGLVFIPCSTLQVPHLSEFRHPVGDSICGHLCHLIASYKKRQSQCFSWASLTYDYKMNNVHSLD